MRLPRILLVSSVYEAYCVHMFFSFLVAVLGNGHGEAAALDELPATLEALVLFVVDCEYQAETF